jgi:hypothetical protein
MRMMMVKLILKLTQITTQVLEEKLRLKLGGDQHWMQKLKEPLQRVDKMEILQSLLWLTVI